MVSRRAIFPVVVLVAAACTASSPFHTPPSAGAAAGEPAPGVSVYGVVVEHESGDSLSGVSVSLASGPGGIQGRGTRVTDEAGAFSFEGVPDGTYRLVVRFEGYRDMADTLQVLPASDLEVIIPLSTGSASLEPIIVEQPLPEAPRGYERRRAGGSRFLITREEILEREPRYVSELLNRMPGGIVVPSVPYGYELRLRNQCRPGIWVDGVPRLGARSIDMVVSPRDVDAVEVYHGFELPVEFGVNSCGGILVWTRRGPVPPPDGVEEDDSGIGIWSRLISAAVIIVAVFLVTR